MVRFSGLFIFLFLVISTANSQRLVTRTEAVSLALRNRVNIAPAELELQRQQQLLKGAANFDNPELEYEIDPYDPTVLGVLVPLRLPSVYSNRKNLQRSKIRLSELMLRMNQNEINRLVHNTYTEVQYLQARMVLLRQQDSLYQSIKAAASRSFQAGQINKLEDLFAGNEANNVRNELEVATIELSGQKKALAYLSQLGEAFTVDTFNAFVVDSLGRSITENLPATVQTQVLQQQVSVSEQELKMERSELLPQLTTGPLFGLQNPVGESRKLGFRVGLSIPLWFGQNRSRVQAAQTGVQLAQAESARQLQSLQTDYQSARASFQAAGRNLLYYSTVASQQADEIIQTARRLFVAGETNYIEMLRNIIVAYTTKAGYLQAIRNYNQSVIELRFLTGNF
jgi:outer membrane protein, heavy metal efflux system